MNWIQVLRRAGLLALGAAAFWCSAIIGGDDIPMREMLFTDPARLLCALALAALGMLFVSLATMRGKV